jgi:ABC-2 type transport system ATP-binding protein
MDKVKQAGWLVLRLALACYAMAIAYDLSTLLIWQANAGISLKDVFLPGREVFLVSIINALILSYPILRSPWHGLKLVAAVFVVQFGVETFMTQIETLYFNRALQVSSPEFLNIVKSGMLRALIFAPLAVLIYGKITKPSRIGRKLSIVTPAGWGLLFAAIAVLYPLVYFLFGYFVAWQWAELRLFYTGSTAIQPFLTHFQGFFSADHTIIFFQLLRGALWTALAVLIVQMMKVRRWEASLGVALVFAGLMTSGLALFPNPYFPPKVVQAHFFEILSSMLLFGGMAGWLMDISISPRKVADKAIIYTPKESDLPMNDAMIQVRNFKKMYGNFAAVDDISFDIQPGEIFGLLGPNGAGKTSTLECLEGLRQPNGGLLRVAGIDPASDARKLRNVIGVQLQSAGLPESITPDEAIKFFCAYHEVAPRFDLLERFGLQEKRNTQFYELSGGQQRRLVLALAVAHEPQVLFLDEPTAGLDVATRVELHDTMKELQARGTTIILATHDMAEAEEMSDRVAILLNGKIVTIGTPLEITATGAGLTKVSVRTQNACLSAPDISLPAVSQQSVRDEYSIFFSSDIGPTLSAIIATIQAQNDTLIDLRVERPSLEDRFLELTNSGAAQ